MGSVAGVVVRAPNSLDHLEAEIHGKEDPLRDGGYAGEKIILVLKPMRTPCCVKARSRTRPHPAFEAPMGLPFAAAASVLRDGGSLKAPFRCAESAAWSEIFDQGAPECISACSTVKPRT